MKKIELIKKNDIIKEPSYFLTPFIMFGGCGCGGCKKDGGCGCGGCK